VIDQIHTNWELLVIDDASDDNTVEVIKSFSETDKRIKLIERNRLPKGAQHCRNIGMLNALGEYVIFLDSDDLLAPFCLSQRLAAMKQADNLDFMVFPQLTFNNTPGDSSVLINIPTNETALDRFFTLGHCLDVPWITTAPIFKRASLVKHSLEWDLSTRGFQDFEFNVSALIAGLKFQYAANPPDNYYRVHTESRIGDAIFSPGTTVSSEKMLLRLYKRIDEGGLLTKELRLRITKSFFYILIEKLVWVNNRAGAFNTLRKMKEVALISNMLYFQIWLYIFSNASYFKPFNSLRNKVFYRFWRNSIYKRTPENYLKHTYPV
jgi:glycosyltransferase involved in cell wall biosynthesis